MSLAPRLDIRQSQSLVMTPQLQQAIKLLALSNLEIEGFIAEEIERNPLLEAGAADDGDRPDRDAGPEPDAAPSDTPRDERVAADELVAGTGAASVMSSRGLASSASPMKVSISRLDSASSLIACWSCGVITSDCDCLRSRRGPSAISQFSEKKGLTA